MHEITDRPEHAPPPQEVRYVRDRDHDLWERTEEGWVSVGTPGAKPWPWSTLTRHFGPCTWPGQKPSPDGLIHAPNTSEP